MALSVGDQLGWYEILSPIRALLHVRGSTRVAQSCDRLRGMAGVSVERERAGHTFECRLKDWLAIDELPDAQPRRTLQQWGLAKASLRRELATPNTP